MGTLSLIIGIIVFLTALFPNLGYMIIIAAVVGLILGICRVANEKNSAWGIAGIVLNGVAIVIALFWTAIITFSEVEVFNHVLIPNNSPENIQVMYQNPETLNSEVIDKE